MNYKKILNTDKADFMMANGNIILLISSVCNVRCKFCYNESNPFVTDKVGFRPIDEIRSQLETYGNISNDGIYFLGAQAFGFQRPEYKLFANRTTNMINFGEPTIHPNFFEILKMLRDKSSKTIFFHTNGTKLTESFVKKLSDFHPLQIILSCNTFNKEIWMDVFRGTETDYITHVSSIDLLKKYNINFMPNLIPNNGIEDLENSLKFLAEKDVKNIMVGKLGYTKFSPHTHIEHCIKNEIKDETTINNLFEKYNLIRIDFKFSASDVNTDSLVEKILELNKHKTHCFVFTSVSAHDNISGIIDDIKHKYQINIDIEILEVENKAYGGNVECAGLWSISDIEDKINEYGLVNHDIIIPSVFLNDYGFDLFANNIQDYIPICKNTLHIIQNN